MNKIIFLSVFTIFFSVLNAQNYSVTPNPASGTADLDNLATEPDDVVAYAYITNNTSDSIFLKWERIMNDKPGCWETAVCDPNLCYQPNKDTEEFGMAANQSNSDMLVHAYPGKKPGGIDENGADPGDATVVLKITNLNDPSDTTIVTYHIEVAGSPIGNCTVGLSELEFEALKIFPNPTLDFFRLTETQEIQQLVVYNILGNQVRQFQVSSNQNYYIADLPNGVYLVGMIDRDFEIVKTVKLQKY